MKNSDITFANLMNNDIVDIRDIIEHFEELETRLVDRFNELNNPDDAITDYESQAFQNWLLQIRYDDDQAEEFIQALSLINNLKGCGGDEQWRGDWYPITLIRDDYFEDYARDLAEDIGAINRDAVWPSNCIDWKQAARELEYDYSAVEYENITYLYR